MVREPSWHKLERAVLKESPKTWEDARREADINWEVETGPVWDVDEGEDAEVDIPEVYRIPGFQKITRNDRTIGEASRYLTIQPDSYAVIHNAEYGEVIDQVLSITGDDEPVTFEALMSLYGGRQIVALVSFDEPLKLAWDEETHTYRFIAFSSRHDGQGGLRGIPTNIRVVCANTLSWAEATDGRRTGFTIRHTSNWESRLAEVRAGLAIAKGESERWVTFAEELAKWKVGGRQRETFLKRFLPISDDMTALAVRNAEVAREDLRRILKSDTTASVANNGYGLLMAATEWTDHVRRAQSKSSAISRQVLVTSPYKAKAARILLSMSR
jgi:phage/plasmid-like protein (TIGR03299 family)